MGRPRRGARPDGARGRVEPVTPAYRLVMAVSGPVIRRWGRLEVTGLEHLPVGGPLLIAANHDSYWDPVAGGVAAIGHRQIRALAKSELWDVRGLGPILDGMGQIPVERGATDVVAFARAIAELRAGACVGIFPEGTRSRGRVLRARSGLGRLAAAVPEAEVVCCAIAGTTDLTRFPVRPRLRVDFFPPAGGGLRAGETPAAFGARVLAELRARAPISAAGRGRRRTG